MSRNQRIRIVLGISTSLMGLAVCVLAPALCAWIYSAQFDSDSPNALHESIAVIQKASHLSLVVQLSGCVLSTMGFLTTFVQWACWFIGPHKSVATE